MLINNNFLKIYVSIYVQGYSWDRRITKILYKLIIICILKYIYWCHGITTLIPNFYTN